MNQEDITVGYPSGRRIPGFNLLVGFFINNLPLRIRFSPTSTFSQVLEDITKFMSRPGYYDYYPLYEITKIVRKNEQYSQSNLFNNIFSSANFAAQGFQLQNIKVTSELTQVEETSKDFLFLFDNQGEDIRCAIEYSVDLYPEEEVNSFIASFQKLVSSILTYPDLAIKDLEILDAERKTFISLTWSRGESKEVEGKNVIERIEEHVLKHGANSALTYGETRVSYVELNEKVNRAAHYLREIGVERDKTVAVRLSRGIEQITWILAILKAGGCYLPIDPSYPIERQKYILEDSQTNLLITDDGLEGREEIGYTSCVVINVSSLREMLEQYSKANPVVDVKENDLAYIIYTSGSSGQPKGVMIEHKGLLNLAQAQAKLFEISEKSIVLQFASISFDASVSEWSTALTSGACLCLVPEGSKETGGTLADLSYTKDVTVATLPPSLAQALPIEAFPHLKTLIVAGEACSEQVINKWSHVKLINAYGPTECTVCATAFECDPNYTARTIGRPIANSEIYILDETLKPVPEGVIGEIYIGGVGVARGYLNKPDLTQEKFITAEIGDQGPVRIYKSGDLGRWIKGGNIEYIGREDFQVKIRGYRIELGEIEETLGKVKGVKTAVVIAEEEPSPRLVAYILYDTGAEALQDFLLSELKLVCHKFLPDYMIPAAFVMLSEFPVTSHGKIDRKALVAKGKEVTFSEREYIKPSTETEKILASLWSELLGVKDVGLNDNFFELGGDSIISIQLLLKCQKLGLSIDITKIFSYPTLGALAQQIEVCQNNNLTFSGIHPRKNNSNIPLSFAQQRLWFLNKMMDNKTIYNILLPLDIKGNLNIKALNKAFQELLKRHEVLRTKILYNGEEPIQYIEDTVALSIVETILPHLSEKQLRQAILDAAQASMKEPFDLEVPPLLRIQLLRIKENHHILLLTMHHLISDGWSIDVLFKDLSQFYNALILNQEPNLPALTIQYADFALWQREWLEGDILTKQLNYWEKQLVNAPNKMNLPTDYPRGKHPSYQGAHFSYIINDQILSGINKLLSQENVTLFMFLAAVLQILLSRYSREKDVVIGFPIANRHYVGTENLIGFFVNTLPLRSKLEDNLRFIELLRQVHSHTSSAYDHQDVPFELLVDRLKVERNVGWNPLFQVVFGLQNVGNSELKLPNLSIKPFPIDMQIARFDLTISAIKTEQGITLGFEYATDLFESKTIKRMAEHFEELIYSIISHPHKKIGEFNYLTQDERHQLIKWGINHQVSEEMTVLQLFERQAKNNPKSNAVLQQNQAISYEELNEKANKAAHYLREIGVEKDKIVAVRLSRGIEQITWILAILKAGGCYLPIDPSYPAERQKYILEDSQTNLLITDDGLEGGEEIGYTSCVVINVSSLRETLGQYSNANPVVDVQEDDLAYVIYTSGSSGHPKGVMIEHRGVANLAQAQAKLFEINEKSKILQFASVSFDAAVWEWISALCHGATLVTIADNQDILKASPEDIQNISHITIATLPPSLAQALPIETFPNLKTLIVAGEACSEQVINKWSHVKLINAYGPTECTVCATAFECDPSYTARTIGRPIANSEIYILDETLKPVPEGVIGEIYIGGVGVARGYLNKPDLTQEKFITAEIGDQGPVRIYKSGDLGRWIKGGNIEYIGREDFQVKIRGYRIELGEIEETLGKVKGVKTAVVIAEKEPSPRLVAYIVPHLSGVDPLDQEKELIFLITQHAKKQLPNYMVPSRFCLVDEIPLTVNGKVDTVALAHKENNKKADETPFQATIASPQTPTEEILQGVLSRVLKAEKVSTDGNFFALGGDSILSIQYSIEAKKCGLDFSINQLFDNPTIKQLAKILDNNAIQLGAYPPILPQLENSATPLSFAQQRLWFVNQLLGETHIYNVPLVIDLQGDLDLNSLNFAFNKIIERHEILRTRIVQKNDHLEQAILPHDHEFTITHKNLRNLPDHKQSLEEILRRYSTEPFDLSEGKMLKIILFKLSPQHHILLVVMHHMITDGWSLGIFNKELSYYYNLNKNHEKNDLTLPQVQYGAYALWQRDWLRGERLTEQLEYWQTQLKDIPPVINFPTDKARPQNRDYKGKHYKCSLDMNVLKKIKSFAEKNDVSLFMTLLAVFQLLIYRYTNEKKIVVGSPIANRHYPDVENTMGFFVNTIALKTDFEQDYNFSELLQTVKKTTLSAYQNQDLPFEKLVEYLNVERNLSWHPIFQIMFSLDNIENNELNFAALKAELLDIDIKIAKFDLSLTVREEANSLMLNFEYAEDLFLESTIARMAEHFTTLLSAVLEAPQENIEHLSFLSDKETHEVIYKWNKTESPYPLDKTAIALFEEQVACTPHRLALVANDQKLTFQELNIKVNQLASYFMSVGVTREVIVPIVLGRSSELIISILSILKAGGAYLPLDITFPPERILNIVSETNSSFIVCDNLFASQVPDGAIPLLQLEQIKSKLTNYNTGNPQIQASLDDLAYVIYTSGSSGRPKGVMIEHRSLTNYLLWCASHYSCTHNTSSVLHSSCAYDMAVTSLFLPLIKGRAVHVVGEEGAGQELPILFNTTKGKHDFIKVTPSHLKMLESLPKDKIKNQTQSFIIGGELLTQAHLTFWQENFPHILLYNEYGPTEATVACSAFLVRDNQCIDPIPIGRPITNTQLYILDKHMKPVGIGLPGQLYIGGAGVARGYLNRKELTAEMFIRNPFSSDERSRLYKTGDLASYLEDGNIQYLGRIDNQVKIRGYRIELGEIEASIEKHESIKSCAVVVKLDKGGHAILVAYVVLHEELIKIGQMKEEAAHELRSYLQRTLPDYMIPSYFVVLNHLPLNANGKLDRSQLPELGEVKSNQKKVVIKPKNQVEKDLVLLWKELLEIDQVSVDDNFFMLGGHSMLMTKVVMSVAKKFGVNLSLRSFFEDPTIVNLANIILQQNVSIEAKLPTHLLEDAQLEDSIQLPPNLNTSHKAQTTSPSIILLTGATGFLGTHLLLELCKQNYTKIYCLVREKSLKAAYDKIIQSGQKYNITYEEFLDVIHPVLGDIEKPYLGLNQEDYAKLCDEVDIIYHNAAWVNHVVDYNKLRKANVLSTKKIIHLASHKKIKHINYISTLSNYYIDANNTIQEEPPEAPYSLSLTGGYALTKAVSEILLNQANTKGIPVTIFRPNYIIGSTQNGATSFEHNHLLSLIKGCIQLKSAPTWDLELDLSPVDFIAKLIAHIATTEPRFRALYNITNPTKITWEQLISFLQRTGFEINSVPEKEWRSKLLQHVDMENALYPFLSIYLDNSENSSGNKKVTILNTNTVSFMNSKGLTWPIIDDYSLEQYLAYLSQGESREAA